MTTNEPSKLAIEPDEVVSFLKREVDYKEVRQKILSQRVIEKAAKERSIVVTLEEIQAEANRLRREKRLEKASDTLAWLADQMISVEDWEAGIREHLLTQKLAQYLFAKEVEKYFAQNRLNYDQVLLYQVVVPNQRIAQELFYQIEEEEISFYEAAHLYDIDERRRYHCGYEGKLYRWSLDPDVAPVVFSAPLDEVIGPLKIEQNYCLLKVEELISAELTLERHQDIIGQMFQEWLTGELNYMLHSGTN